MADFAAAYSDLAEELAPSLGSRPEVVFDGPIDNAIPQHIADHLLAVLRESLTNAGKHAQATKFVVTLRVSTEVILEVADNGKGIVLPPEGGGEGLGLSNLRDRRREAGRHLRYPVGARRRHTGHLVRAGLIRR